MRARVWIGDLNFVADKIGRGNFSAVWKRLREVLPGKFGGIVEDGMLE